MPKITRYGGASIAGEAGPELVNLPAGSPVEAAEPAPAMSGPAKPRKDATVSPETARGRHERTD